MSAPSATHTPSTGKSLRTNLQIRPRGILDLETYKPMGGAVSGSFLPSPRYPRIMERLPLETLQQIFKLACTDGGYTGCSLALTSKSIREAAHFTRFYSISLGAKTERLVALVALYQGQCSNAAGLQPRVSHLHLSFQKTANTSLSEDPVEEDEWDEESEDDEEASSSPRSSPVVTRLIAAQQLLSLVADDLQSLVITKANAVQPLFDRAFPSLRELTFVRHTDPSKSIAPDSKILPLFPALTHLHIVAPDSSQPLLPSWIAHAPRVTHLRISAHSRFYKLFDELPGAVGTPPSKRGFRPGTAVTPPPAVRTYPTLVCVVVQPGPPPVAGACGTSQMMFSTRMYQLGRMASQAETAGVEMHAMSPCSWTRRHWDEAIYEEWIRRIGGEPGRDWFSDADEDEDEDEDGE